MFGEPRIFGDDATGYGPIFEEEPLDIVYTKESPDRLISMNCRARANPAPTYRWRRDNWEIKLMELPNEHYSLVGGNLIINNPEEKKHAGTYVCVAKNVYGTVISKEAKVKFGYLEEFPDEERDPVTVKEGQGAVLLCAPPKRWPTEVTFRWIYNEFPVFLHPDKRRFVSQSTGNLYISKVEASDAGNYSCYVFNPQIGKGVYSKFIPLISTEESEYKADLVVKFPDTTAMLNYNVTLECFALGNPAPHIVWRKIGATDLPASAQVSMSGALLHLYNVQYEDSAGYECEAINQKWQDWHQAWLYVEVCNTNYIAAPRPRFTWTKGKEVLFNNSRISIMFDGSLEILNATRNDEGVYTCLAENDRGKANSTGTLTITEATQITVAPEDTQVMVGEEVHLQCQASFDPSLDITFIWSLDFRVIDFYLEWKHYERIMVGGIDSGELKIMNVQLRHEGRYTCTAQTVVDNVTASADLKIKGLPAPPGGVRVEEIRDTSVKLVWNRGADHGSPILGYTIQTRDFYALTEVDWRDASTSPTALDRMSVMADVVDLYPWMEYEFRVYATNEFGDGEASIPSMKIKTWDAVPVVAPTNVGGYGGKDGELIITWTPVQPQYFYGKKFGYVVAFKPHDDVDWWYETISDPETRRYVHRDASFRVKSNDFQFWFKLIDTCSDQSRLSDQVKYWRKYDDTEPGANRIFVPASMNQTRLENMLPDSHYLIEVRAYNGAGVGPPSEHCEMFTKRAPPSVAPQMWRYISYSGKWLYVWWHHISYDWFGNESFPLYYKVMFRKTGYITGPIYMTGWHFIDFPMPQVGDYELEVRGRYEGGDGPIRKIRLQGKPTLSLAAMLLLALCIVGLGI
uniref:Contactin 1b n=1 Tax=Oncorhynchus tshawytscha TaxID=74940 RepID=A0AAZ3P827_ONCTS